MVQFSAELWALLAGIAGVGVLAMLHSFATIIRNQCHVHDLKVRVNSLKIEYQAMAQARREAAEEGAMELGDVEIVSGPAPARSRKAA